MKKLLITLISLIFISMLSAEEKEKNPIKPDKIIDYKKVKTEKGKFDLKLHIFNPANDDKKRPCIVLFHGGGWVNGSPTSYYRSGKRWADKGMVAIAVEYRIRKKHGGTPLDSVRDAKSAMRYIRSHADELGIDPNKIVATGGSAGGHLAAACATLTAFDEEDEDTKVSCRPDALILKSPVLDNAPKGGYGHYHKAVHKNWKDFSPFHNIKKDMPPTFISMGDNEIRYLRVEIAKELKKKIEDNGSRCELIVLKGATHRKRTKEQNEKVQKASIEFLQSLGFIKIQK